MPWRAEVAQPGNWLRKKLARRARLQRHTYYKALTGCGKTRIASEGDRPSGRTHNCFVVNAALAEGAAFAPCSTFFRNLFSRALIQDQNAATRKSGATTEKAFRKPLKSVPLGLIAKLSKCDLTGPHASH